MQSTTIQSHLLAAALLVSGTSVQAGDGPCSFNGKYEPCSVSRGPNTIKVLWHSDGKTVHYYLYGCKTSTNQTAQECSVRIVEDNGRVTHGISSSGGRGTSVLSDRGNRANIGQ